jgi:hypothetical protein
VLDKIPAVEWFIFFHRFLLFLHPWTGKSLKSRKPNSLSRPHNNGAGKPSLS